MDFDTDIWSEIEDSNAEIFEVDESSDEEFNFNKLLHSNIDFWCLTLSISLAILLLFSV